VLSGIAASAPALVRTGSTGRSGWLARPAGVSSTARLTVLGSLAPLAPTGRPKAARPITRGRPETEAGSTTERRIAPGRLFATVPARKSSAATLEVPAPAGIAEAPDAAVVRVSPGDDVTATPKPTPRPNVRLTRFADPPTEPSIDRAGASGLRCDPAATGSPPAAARRTGPPATAPARSAFAFGGEAASPPATRCWSAEWRPTVSRAVGGAAIARRTGAETSPPAGPSTVGRSPAAGCGRTEPVRAATATSVAPATARRSRLNCPNRTGAPADCQDGEPRSNDGCPGAAEWPPAPTTGSIRPARSAIGRAARPAILPTRRRSAGALAVSRLSARWSPTGDSSTGCPTTAREGDAWSTDRAGAGDRLTTAARRAATRGLADCVASAAADRRPSADGFDRPAAAEIPLCAKAELGRLGAAGRSPAPGPADRAAPADRAPAACGAEESETRDAELAAARRDDACGAACRDDAFAAARSACGLAAALGACGLAVARRATAGDAAACAAERRSVSVTRLPLGVREAAPALAAGAGVGFPLPGSFPGGEPGRGACSRRCSCELVIGPAATTSSIRRTGIAVDTRLPAIAPGDRGWLSVGTCRAARASPRAGSAARSTRRRTGPVTATTPASAETGTAGVEPAEAEPLDAEPPEAEPADAEPPDAEAKPLDAEPSEAEPAPARAGRASGTAGPAGGDSGCGDHQRGGRTSAAPSDRTGAPAEPAIARRIATGRPVEAANRTDPAAT